MVVLSWQASPLPFNPFKALVIFAPPAILAQWEWCCIQFMGYLSHFSKSLWCGDFQFSSILPSIYTLPWFSKARFPKSHLDTLPTIHRWIFPSNKV
jgi:hypothetical protein